jgi:hypothetical protein
MSAEGPPSRRTASYRRRRALGVCVSAIGRTAQGVGQLWSGPSPLGSVARHWTIDCSGGEVLALVYAESP